MIFGRRRRQLQQELDEARAIREDSEAALQRDDARTRIPLREMRERNHVAADVVKVIRRRGQGEPGTAAR